MDIVSSALAGSIPLIYFWLSIHAPWQQQLESINKKRNFFFYIHFWFHISFILILRSIFQHVLNIFGPDAAAVIKATFCLRITFTQSSSICWLQITFVLLLDQFRTAAVITVTCIFWLTPINLKFWIQYNLVLTF